MCIRDSNVYYERQERFAGESKYPLKKMLSFAFDGITSFSVKPIRFILSLGLVIFLASLGILIYSIVRHAMGATVLGWSSLMAVSYTHLHSFYVFQFGQKFIYSFGNPILIFIVLTVVSFASAAAVYWLFTGLSKGVKKIRCFHNRTV